MSQHLLTPITLRDLTVRNRIWVPPMCQYSVAAGDGAATDYHLMHYGSFARGGAGGPRGGGRPAAGGPDVDKGRDNSRPFHVLYALAQGRELFLPA